MKSPLGYDWPMRNRPSRRLPAEWEPQDAILMAWPHTGTDWEPVLPDAHETFARIIAAITRFQEVILLVGDDPEPPLSRLDAAGAITSRIRLFTIPTDDTWTRDYGPITVERDGLPLLLDFGFNGWGLKFRAFHDNQVTRRLHETGLVTPPRETVGMILEGGSIDSDGEGTILTTTACLLHPNRNPQWTRQEIERMLHLHLGAHRVLWLSNGHLEGDDTDAHIDTLARFVSPDTLCLVTCDDPADPHYLPLLAMRREIEGFSTLRGGAYRLVELPLPSPIHDEDGNRLPATHANFLILNGAVLVPTYDDPSDSIAIQRLSAIFPDRTVIGIDCRTLIRQHGSLHCVTMQLYRGTMK
ncbi:MAG: agmatine deiminase family protein [Desulfuromonadia bacterium]